MDALWQDHLRQVLAEQKSQGLARSLQRVDGPLAPEVKVNGRRVLLFCANDYLGLTQHPALKETAREAAAAWGSGSGASRLVSGNVRLYGELEEDLARFKKAEAALVFATGFMTNLGLITALAGPGDLILSDALNHASLVDACRLSRAETRVVPHGDVEAVARELSAARGRRVLILTEGVFSMDGDVAPLAELAALARVRGALLVVDDAHGTGVLGPSGRGSLEHLGLDPAGVVQVGTFSKALGSLGGFVAGPGLVIELLKNRARSLFYSTALPPAVLAVNRRALALVDEEPERRARVLGNARFLAEELAAAGLTVRPGPAAIIPVLIGEAERANALAGGLLSEGLFCPAIRPPTVPPGQSRLRLSVMATHTQAQLEQAMALISRVARRVGVL